jgi:hypothetical protein
LIGHVPPAACLADLEEFVHDHHTSGGLTADATEPSWNRYRFLLAWAEARRGYFRSDLVLPHVVRFLATASPS